MFCVLGGIKQEKLTSRFRFDDGLSKLHHILLLVIFHVPPQHHVLVEISCVHEGGRQTYFADICVDVMFTF